MRLRLTGYDLLGDKGEDGVRYTWSTGKRGGLVESAAFSKRARIPVTEKDAGISAYTTSVSAGCILSVGGLACRFCRTGQVLRFGGTLTPEEIALQNVLMVLADVESGSWPAVRGHAREFAYMGQGEPGFSYPQVRTAIKLTDTVMMELGQPVHRHIIATCGIPEMVDTLHADLRASEFSTRVTLHFSLHAVRDRARLMPIEEIYPHRAVMAKLAQLHEIGGGKPCVGILLFRHFRPTGASWTHTTDTDDLEVIADLLDAEKHRVSLCEFNESEEVGSNDPMDRGAATEMLNVFERRSIEAKLFASFGAREHTACGLLGGTTPSQTAGEGLLTCYRRAVELVTRAARRSG